MAVCGVVIIVPVAAIVQVYWPGTYTGMVLL